MCQILIEASANVNIANNEGNTPLHYISRCNVNSPEMQDVQLEVLRCMIRHGGDVNAMNDLGETPLHASCFLGNVNIAKILLEGYADPNSITKEGESALHYAVQARNPKVVELLLEFGANPYLTCNGVNPVDLAYKYNVPEITEIFRTLPLACEIQNGQPFIKSSRRSMLIQSHSHSNMPFKKTKKKKHSPLNFTSASRKT